AAQPFLVNLARLSVPAHQVFHGVRAQSLAARVEVLVLLPHRLARDVLGMFPVDVVHERIRPRCSPIILTGLHSCQSRYPSASDRCVLSRSRSLSIWQVPALKETCSKSMISSLHLKSTSSPISPAADRSLELVRLIRSRTPGVDLEVLADHVVVRSSGGVLLVPRSISVNHDADGVYWKPLQKLLASLASGGVPDHDFIQHQHP